MTQIVVDDELMEYEPGQQSNGLFHKRARVKSPQKFQVIHDMNRPRSQSLCLVKSGPAGNAPPVETEPDDQLPSPQIDSQWRLESLRGNYGA